jgi:hypothetical protein
MSTSSFAWPVALPCFIGDERKFDVWANGLIYGDQIYDGFTNKVEITPTVAPPGMIFGNIPVGQKYTIGENHLRRLILQSQPNYEAKVA